MSFDNPSLSKLLILVGVFLLLGQANRMERKIDLLTEQVSVMQQECK